MKEEMENEKQSDLFYDIYETRLLLFMETEPQSNKYFQVILSPEEFENVSKSIGKKIGVLKDKISEEVELKLSEEIYDLPDLVSCERKKD